MTDLITGPGTYRDKDGNTAEVKAVVDGLAFGLDSDGDSATWRLNDGAWMGARGAFSTDDHYCIVEALNLDTTPTWDGTGLPPVGAKVEYWSNVAQRWYAPLKVIHVTAKNFVMLEYEGANDRSGGHEVVDAEKAQRVLRPYTPDHLAAAIKADLKALPMVESCNYAKAAHAIAIGLRNRGYVHKDDIKVIPEGWEIKPTTSDSVPGFIINTPRVNGVRAGTAVHRDDKGPAPRLLYEILANIWSNDHD